MAVAQRFLIAGNWKMNGLRADGLPLARGVVDGARQSDVNADLLVCPPATLLGEISEIVAGSAVALGAQDGAAEVQGAFTGDISAEMLSDLGCSFTILGHSERRQLHHESDALVAKKVAAAQDAGLCPIVCVGETEAQRNDGSALATVRGQISGSLPPSCDPGNLVVAYEPVWAIGTGRTPTLAEIKEVHGDLYTCLRDRFDGAGPKIRLLYGGSVKPDNAAEILAVQHVDGALVGGASLVAESFLAIARAGAA